MLDFTSGPARSFAPGIGQAVADRTVARLVERPLAEPLFLDIEIERNDGVALDDAVTRWARDNGWSYSGYHVKKGDDLSVKLTVYVTGKREREAWEDVARRVALGNCAINGGDFDTQFAGMHNHMRKATLLMSGRHLQHGDETQSGRPMEVFCNCATSAISFITFYLLLNGAGVGSDYSDESITADLSKMPVVVPVIDWNHADVAKGLARAMSREQAEHLYAGRKITTFVVPDSREGWAEAIAIIETMAFEGRRDEVLLIDFSKVRPNGSPIKGMQNRPASGPGPLISAITNLAKLRDAGMEPWRAKLYADHYMAEVVLVGGARRAARMSTKWWQDPGIFDFIRVKKGGKFLWSSNNSVTVDSYFWSLVNTPLDSEDPWSIHAHAVFDAVTDSAYHDGTGEPGFINVDTFKAHVYDDAEKNKILSGELVNPNRLSLTGMAEKMIREAVKRGINSLFPMITNPCGEIQLVKWGGYCVIADVVPYHADSLDDAESAFRTATRALMRVNLMDSLFRAEVKRTNRIGVGFTGIFEFALNHFGFGWKDLVDEGVSIRFWQTMGRFSKAVKAEVLAYSHVLGVAVPHTDTTVKPAGCASLDTLVKTTEGPMTMRAIFARNGYDEATLSKMADGTWINPKEPVLVLDKNNDAKVTTSLYVNGITPVYEIEFEDGATAKLTGNHKLMTKSGWKRVDELSVDDEVTQY